MKTLPIDTIVKVNGYGIGIIVDVLYSSKLYRVSFQGKEYLLSFSQVVPEEISQKEKLMNNKENKTQNHYTIGTIVYHQKYGKGTIISNATRNGLYMTQFGDEIHYIGKEYISLNTISPSKENISKQCERKNNVGKPKAIESGDFVYCKAYGHGLVIRKIENEGLLDCKFGKIRIYLKPEYLTKEDYSPTKKIDSTSTVPTKKTAVRNKGISHTFTTKNSTFSTNNTEVVRDSKYALTGNASNPANRQESSTNICKSTAEGSPPKPSQKRLMIKFPDGTIISNDDIEETYIDALWELDPDSIMLNNISFNGISIITSKNTRGGRVQVGINQWAYVPSLTMDIIKVLETISKALNIDIEIHEIN